MNANEDIKQQPYDPENPPIPNNAVSVPSNKQILKRFADHDRKKATRNRPQNLVDKNRKSSEP